MVSAVLSAEDRDFFNHIGMDLVGLGRAAWVDLKARAVKQGGSTITQQLIRQVALTTDRNFQRKIKEALLALRVERRFDKNKILEAYLNRIYLGNGHYGVEAAARGYFAKPASELDSRRKRVAGGHHPVPVGLLASDGAERRQGTARHGAEGHARKRRHRPMTQYAEALASHAIALAAERHDPYTRDASRERRIMAPTRRVFIFSKACAAR